jgi:hypothetical protein
MGLEFLKYVDEDVVDEFLRSPLGYGVCLFDNDQVRSRGKCLHRAR